MISGKLDGLRAEKVIFRNTVFTDVSFRHMECTDVLFDKCDVSNADFSGSIIHRTAFQHSKLLGLNLADSAMRHVRFEDCLAHYSSFSYSNMKHVRFDTCGLSVSPLPPLPNGVLLTEQRVISKRDRVNSGAYKSFIPFERHPAR